MASVYITSTHPPYNPSIENSYGVYERFLEAVQCDRFGIHHVCDHFAQANIILFVGAVSPDLKDVLNHPIRKTYFDKTFLYHMGDGIIPWIPGIYTSLQKCYHLKNRTCGGAYTIVHGFDDIKHSIDYDLCDILFSFVGRLETHDVRIKMAQSLGSQGVIVATGTPSDKANSKEDYRKRYIDILNRSCFVLCPRGFGTSSFRLFETLKAGRCPVIISDEWVAPEGPNWPEFSIQVPESAIATIPVLLKKYEHQAATMGAQARQAWCDWFSKEVTFHRTVEWCLQSKDSKRLPEIIIRSWLKMKRLRYILMDQKN